MRIALQSRHGLDLKFEIQYVGVVQGLSALLFDYRHVRA